MNQSSIELLQLYQIGPALGLPVLIYRSENVLPSHGVGRQGECLAGDAVDVVGAAALVGVNLAVPVSPEQSNAIIKHNRLDDSDFV